jgi:hypothetical protein
LRTLAEIPVMTAHDPLIAMTGARVLVPDADVELVFYAAFCRGLGELQALNAEQRATVVAAMDAFRDVYRGGWVGGQAFLTHAEMVFIPHAAHRAGHPAALAFRIPLTDVLALDTERGVLRDTLTLRTIKGRLELRSFLARRFGARIELACAERLGEISAASLRPQAA